MLLFPIGGRGKTVTEEEACGCFPCSCVGIEWHADEKELGRERKGEERDVLPERKTTVALPRIGLGRGRRVVAEAGAGKEVVGVTFL